MVEYHLFWSFCGQNVCYGGFPDFRKEAVQPYFAVLASEWIAKGHFMQRLSFLWGAFSQEVVNQTPDSIPG